MITRRLLEASGINIMNTGKSKYVIDNEDFQNPIGSFMKAADPDLAVKVIQTLKTVIEKALEVKSAYADKSWSEMTWSLAVIAAAIAVHTEIGGGFIFAAQIILEIQGAKDLMDIIKELFLLYKSDIDEV